MPLTTDSTKFPLVVVTWSGKPTDAEFDAYLAAMSANNHKKRKWVFIINLTDAEAPSSKQMNLQADVFQREAALITEYSIGTFFVAPTFLVRTLLKGVLAFSPPPGPYKFLTTLDDAMKEAKEALRGAGVAQF